MKFLQALAIGAAVLVSACARPKLVGLDVTSGPPHTLVMVEGTDLDDASVLWDNNPIPSGFLGAHMFSVPPGAAPLTTHNVVLRNSHGDSTKTVQFTVTAPGVPYPRPRIDAVTLAGASFDSPGHVTAGLYVQGANIDVGAVVLLVPPVATAPAVKCPAKVIPTINPTELATASHKALRNGLFNLPATEFDYPIRHFLSTVSLSGSRTAGETICLAVRNLDLLTSDVVSYGLPVDAETLDSDGDSLPDSLEQSGYASVGLPTLKTDPYRRDILLQLDVMAAGTSTASGLQHPPGPPTFDAARAMFDNAPFLNPNGPPGIHLVLDTHTIPYVAEVCFNIGAPSWCNDAITANPAVKKFSDLKSANFANASRDKIFHYAIWGAKQTFGVSGQSDWADDFLISFDDRPTSFHTVRSQAEGLVHELGHDLGLTHGGGDNDDEHVAAHWSVMSYSWDKRTGQSDQWRVDYATCGPVYYRTAGANESSTGALPLGIGVAIDYSSGMGKLLVPPPSNTAPAVKTCGKSIDWRFNDRGPDPADWPMVTFDGPIREGDLP